MWIAEDCACLEGKLYHQAYNVIFRVFLASDFHMTVLVCCYCSVSALSCCCFCYGCLGLSETTRDIFGVT